MQRLGTSLPPLTNLSNESAPSTSRQTETVMYAAERARVLFGCYRKGEANDPETYAAAVAAVLSEYPENIIRAVTDPRCGIPSRSDWLPTVAEVKKACEALYGPVRRTSEWDKQAVEQIQNRARLEGRAIPSPAQVQAILANQGIQIAVKDLSPAIREG